jgi:outer membrane protein OmpA-like peptidoglycan-associated protein
VITGHTDDTGGRELNMRLSQQRADTVKNYLSAQRIDDRRLVTQGAGPDQPLVANTSEANRAKNRRVEIQIEPLISQ